MTVPSIQTENSGTQYEDIFRLLTVCIRTEILSHVFGSKAMEESSQRHLLALTRKFS